MSELQEMLATFKHSLSHINICISTANVDFIFRKSKCIAVFLFKVFII